MLLKLQLPLRLPGSLQAALLRLPLSLPAPAGAGESPPLLKADKCCAAAAAVAVIARPIADRRASGL